MKDPARAPLEAFRAPTSLKTSALWASVMFCYIYGDYFGLFVPGRLMRMNAGHMGPLGVATPAIMVGVSLMMIVPSVMIFLSLALPAAMARWLNLGLGLAYSAIMALTLPDAPLFYIVFGVVEIGQTLAISWLAWTWPRREPAS